MTVLTLHEMSCVKQDVFDVIEEMGEVVTFFLMGEQEVIRDEMGSIVSHGIKSKNPEIMKAYPVVFNPTTQQLKKLGLTEECEIAISTPQLQWDRIGLTIEDINMPKAIVVIENRKYIIKEKSIKIRRNGVNAYLNFSLKRK